MQCCNLLVANGKFTLSAGRFKSFKSLVLHYVRLDCFVFYGSLAFCASAWGVTMITFSFSRSCKTTAQCSLILHEAYVVFKATFCFFSFYPDSDQHHVWFWSSSPNISGCRQGNLSSRLCRQGSDVDWVPSADGRSPGPWSGLTSGNPPHTQGHFMLCMIKLQSFTPDLRNQIQKKAFSSK